MSDNTRYWEALKRPPESALKKINGGRLSGKTDISPQWRVKAMTEQFGPVGTGWKYEIVNTWTVPGGDELFAFAQVNLYYREGDAWSDAIPGIGGSKLMQLEKSGLYANDEGFKMAVTDALSVAMKTLGVAADIYLGLWDGSKYVDERTDAPQRKPEPKPDDAKEKTRDYLSQHEAELHPDFVSMALEDIDRAATVQDVRKVYLRIQNKVKETEAMENV